MATFLLSPLNDFAKYVKGKEISSTNGAVMAQTSSSITAFFSTGYASTATAADPTLSVTAAYVSGKGFLVFFDRSILTPTLLASCFGASDPYLIVDDNDGWRRYYAGTYTDAIEGE